MTSKIVVNNIESDAGVSTVFFNSDIGATDGTLNVDGNLTVDGVITYEDVTNIDSVGIITAQSDVSIADKIVHTGDTNTAIRFPAADTFTVETSGSEALRVDLGGRLLSGTISNFDNYKTQISSTAGSLLSVRRTNSNPGSIKISSGASGDNVVFNSNLGYIRWFGFHTSTDYEAARISVEVDDGPGANDMPGRLIFSTTSNGAASPTERLRITSDGQLNLAGNMQFTAATPEIELNNGGPRFRVPSANTLTIHTGGGLGATSSERLRITSAGQLLHTRSDNTTRYDLEFRQTGGIGDGNYSGIHWSQGATGSTNLGAIEIAYANTGRPDMVFKLRLSGGTAMSEAFRIGSDGSVTKTTQPRFLARLSANTTYNPSSFGNYVDFDVEDYDIGGNFTTSGTDQGLFTAPVAGMYLFQASAYCVGQSLTQSWFTVNSARKNSADWVLSSTANFVQNFQMIYLNAGDKVGFHPHKGGTASFSVNANVHHTYFKGCLLG